ncbi:MAG: RNA 2',3'-cyclic phosphodiesterase [Shewanella sp.]
MLQRLFLGFAPNDTQRQQLLQLQQSVTPQLTLHAKPVSKANFHLTLAFLGLANQTQKTQLIESVDKLHRPRFTVQLDKLALWPKAQVCCLKGDRVSTALALLASQAQDLAQQLQLHQSEHPFRPHISLFRKAKSLSTFDNELLLKDLANTTITELTLAPEQLHLYLSSSSDSGVEYHILHSWPLE